jgi:hypothetical protein
VATTKVPLLSFIPRAARFAVAHALARTLRRLSPGNVAGWLTLHAFAKCVLTKAPPHSGMSAAASVLKRCRQWTSGSLLGLWPPRPSDEAGREEAAVGFPVEEDGLPRHLRSTLSTGVTRDTVPERAVQRCLSLVNQGYFAKAAQALSAAKVVRATAENRAEMLGKHPQRANPVFVGDVSEVSVDPFTVGQVLKALHRFTPGAAAGPSGLSIQHLLDACEVPGSEVPSALAHAVNLIACGGVPPAARPFVFGARLIALAKKDGGLRPIACGEALRRVAAKLLCTRHNKQLSVELRAVGQVGVGVAGGAESLTHAARRLSDSWRESPAYLVLKVDFQNAFNLVERELVLEACRRRMPGVLPYAWCAYGTQSTLFFDDEEIPSSCGVQQGDPLGPALFSLALGEVWREIQYRLEREALPPLEMAGWYLDDGCLGGLSMTLKGVIAALEELGPPAGLLLNKSKCEIVHCGMPRHFLEELFPGFARFPTFGDWDLLGCSCGLAEARSRHLGAVLQRGAAKAHVIASLPDPHKGLALLRLTSGAALTTFFARAGGPDPSFEAYDGELRSAVSTLVGLEMTDDVWEQATLPTHLGGFGIRRAAEVAAVAFVASASCAPSNFGVFLLHPEALLPDSALAAVVSSPSLACFPTVAALAASYAGMGGEFGDRRQRIMSEELLRARAAASLARLDVVGQARVTSAGAPHASCWLLPADHGSHVWLSAAEFVVLFRLRLGLPVAPEGTRCGLCGSQSAAEVDALGRHALSCMHGGTRTLLHNALRNELTTLCSEALWQPAREVRPFRTQPTARIDILLRGAHRTPLCVDVALTSPLQRSAVAAAASSVGGAATTYEAVKRARYGTAAADMGYVLVPFVGDMLGAWGATATQMLRQLSHAWGLRMGVPASRASAVVHSRLSLALQRGVAALLLQAGSPVQPRLASAVAEEAGAEPDCG